MTELQSSAIMGQEQQFLLSRQARTTARSSSQNQNRHQHSEDLHAFWTVLRSKLSSWEEKLDLLLQQKPSSQGAAMIHQELEDSKEELQQLRKHCLASSTGGSSSFEDWEVPADLPVADLRLLHTEFTKYSTKWETAREQLIPKGKFIFERYRQEVARRKAQGIPLDAPASTTPSTTSSKTQASSSSSLRNTAAPIGGCIQDLSDVSITIDVNGNVELQGATGQIIIDPIIASALLVRNLKNCTLTM
jgi:hypothetical protein